MPGWREEQIDDLYNWYQKDWPEEEEAAEDKFFARCIEEKEKKWNETFSEEKLNSLQCMIDDANKFAMLPEEKLGMRTRHAHSCAASSGGIPGPAAANSAAQPPLASSGGIPGTAAANSAAQPPFSWKHFFR